MTQAREIISFVLHHFLLLSSHNYVVQSFTINTAPRSLTREIRFQPRQNLSRDSCSHPYPHRIQRMPVLHQSMNTKEAPSTVEDLRKDVKEEEDETISDLDARVLQSLLEDKSLDLKSEENLIKMLKNKEEKDNAGSNNPNFRRRATEDSDSAFSSTFFKVRLYQNLYSQILDVDKYLCVGLYL